LALQPGPAVREHLRGVDTDFREFIFDSVTETFNIHPIAISPLFPAFIVDQIGPTPLVMPLTPLELNPVLLRVNTGGTFFMLVFLTLLF
jgi:hypothetical protein